jgi:hypothetical protein
VSVSELPDDYDPERDFELLPPLGWLNRVDEVLRHHNGAPSDGSPLGMALFRLIRSWERTRGARDTPTAHRPEYWGPTTDADVWAEAGRRNLAIFTGSASVEAWLFSAGRSTSRRRPKRRRRSLVGSV